MAEQVQQGMEPFFNQAEELQKVATELHVGEKQIAEGNDIGEEKLMSENELRSGIDYQMQSRMDVNGKENIPGVMEEPIINTVFEEGNEKHGGQKYSKPYKEECSAFLPKQIQQRNYKVEK